MSQIKGPAILLAQFLEDKPPFDTLENITAWAASLGYKGVQLPVRGRINLIDLDSAAESKDYCDELQGRCNGLSVTNLSSQAIGQLIAVHPAYDLLLDRFAPRSLQGKPKERTAWAVDRMKKSLRASRNLGLEVLPTFSGGFLWPTVYPWPPHPDGLVEQGFLELAKRWKPVLDAAEECGVDLAFEIHPGQDLHDGVTFERFLEATNNHKRVKILYDPSHLHLQCLDYLGYISIYGGFIEAFHVKDAEYNISARSGVYGGYQGWSDRPGRFRSAGDGQIDFKRVFSKLTEVGYDSWAVIEWECCLKDGEQAAREGVGFVESLLIESAKKIFDDFSRSVSDFETNKKILGMKNGND